jgi:hypothetical protein
MDSKKYTCNICNKDYKTYKSMWHHKKHIHINIYTKSTDSIPDIDNLSTKYQHTSTVSNINKEEHPKIKKKDNTLCNYCNNNFSCYSSLHRHLKICKAKTNIIKENNELKQKVSNMEKSLDELKKLMLEMMNKKCKMHPKTLQKMINSNNTTNNITINNNIQYVEVGDEELHKVFSKEEKLKILRGMNSLENLIKYTHLNDDYPQFQNIIITNAKGSQAYTFNKLLQKYVLCDKMELLEKVIDYRFDDLIDFYNKYKDLIKPEKREILERLFLRQKDEKYCADTAKEFNRIIYNECNKDNIKYKSIENGDNDNENELDC